MNILIRLFWRIWNFWFTLPDKLRFVLVGGFNATVQYLLYILFILLLGEQRYQVSLIASWILSTFSSFATQKIFVFCTRGNFSQWCKEYAKCLGVWVVAYFINAVILDLLVKYGSVNVYPAQIIAIVCTTVSSYILFKYFAFKH